MLVSALGSLIKTHFGAALPNSPWPVTLPENPKLPAMTYMLIGGTSAPTFDTSGPQKRRVQVDVVAADYATAEAMREQLIAFLNGYSGTLSDGTFLQYVELIQPLDMPFWNDARQYRCGAEFYLYFNLSN